MMYDLELAILGGMVIGIWAGARLAFWYYGVYKLEEREDDRA